MSVDGAGKQAHMIYMPSFVFTSYYCQAPSKRVQKGVREKVLYVIFIIILSSSTVNSIPIIVCASKSSPPANRPKAYKISLSIHM